MPKDLHYEDQLRLGLEHMRAENYQLRQENELLKAEQRKTRDRAFLLNALRLLDMTCPFFNYEGTQVLKWDASYPTHDLTFFGKAMDALHCFLNPESYSKPEYEQNLRFLREGIKSLPKSDENPDGLEGSTPFDDVQPEKETEAP